MVLGKQKCKKLVDTYLIIALLSNLLRSIFSNLFPFFGISSTDWPISATISTDVPIIISPKAFFTISRLCGVQSTNYVTSWWQKIILFYKINARGVPQHTGRTIGGCAIQMGIALLDPIDEVGCSFYYKFVFCVYLFLYFIRVGMFRFAKQCFVFLSFVFV